MELKILAAAMMDKGCYNLIHKYIEAKDVGPETWKILNVIGEYYERDPNARSADRELVEDSTRRSIPDHNSKARDIIKEVFGRIPKEASVDNLSEYIISTKRERVQSELHQSLLARKPARELAALMEKWREFDRLPVDDISEEVYTGWSVKDLVSKHFEPGRLIKLLPATLNRRTDGGAKPGHHIFVFAPTELGKTLFCINLCYGFLKQGLRVLYVGNEDPIAEIQMRLVNRITSLKKDEVRLRAETLDDDLAKANYGNFTIAGFAPGNFDLIKKYTRELDPHVVILDQLGNFYMGIENPTQSFLAAAKAARALGKGEQRLIVSVGQASDGAYGRAILRKNDIQWSNVDVPGQLDLQLGLGSTEEMESAGLLRVAMCKNKLSGDGGWFDVRKVKEYSRIEDLNNA